ncbi:MAG: carbohydrate-binding domain-containing protein [Rhodopila sp.]|nr:carbohydrate-binding domain-containing protein [Rhodopila sp.]
MSGSISNGNVIGSGSDTITLLMSQDPDGPAGAPGTDGAFTLNVDGQQIGGVQDISAIQADGQEEAFTFQGNFAPGPHVITVTFTNNNGTPGDPSTVGDTGDRNIYVDGVTYDGQTISSTTTPIYQSPGAPPNLSSAVPGNAVFNVNDTTAVPADAPSTPTTTPGPVDYGSGPDTLTLQMSEDPYQGDAQFTVAVDGKQVGGTFTTTAIQYEGQQQAFNLSGNWGSGAHTVTVTYLSDRIGAVNAQGQAYDNQDQNLFVKGVSYDGVQAGGTPWELATDGSQDFSVPSGGQPGTSNTTTSDASSTTTGTTSGTTSDTTTGTTTASGTATSTDNTTVTTPALTASQTQTGSSSGMSFIASPTDSGTSTAGTSNGSGTGDSSATTTNAAPSFTGTTQSTQEWTVPSATSWSDSSGSAAGTGGGHWWMNPQASHTGDTGVYHHG